MTDINITNKEFYELSKSKELIFMFEDYVITTHAMERYAERVSYNKKDIMRRIKNDLYFTKVRRIINHDNVRHVFTLNSKEFIFVKDGSMWILKTVIKRTRERQQEAIERRITEYV